MVCGLPPMLAALLSLEQLAAPQMEGPVESVPQQEPVEVAAVVAVDIRGHELQRRAAWIRTVLRVRLGPVFPRAAPSQSRT